MKNEMPTTILVRETLNLVMLPEIGEEILTTEQREEYQDYTRTDLTDRRTDVDALIKVAVEVAESLTQLTGMNVDDLYEAVDAVTEKRK